MSEELWVRYKLLRHVIDVVFPLICGAQCAHECAAGHPGDVALVEAGDRVTAPPLCILKGIS